MKKRIFPPEIRLGTFSGTVVSADPFIILSLAVIVLSGGAELLLITLPALAVHELAHICSAYLFECRITSFRLSPLGGTLTINNLCRKRFCEEAAVYLSAPLVNISLYSLFYAIGVRSNDIVMLEISLANGALAIFSLIPAVPLDGGAVLKAFLCRYLSVKGSKTILLISSILCSSAILFIFIYTFVAFGDVIWQLLSLCIMLLASGISEFANPDFSAVSDIASKDCLLSENIVLPENRLSVSAEATLARALRSAKIGYVNVFSVYNDKMELIGEFTEQELLSAAVTRGSYIPIGSLVK